MTRSPTSKTCVENMKISCKFVNYHFFESRYRTYRFEQKLSSMSENEWEAKNKRGQRNQRCERILAIKNKQAYKDYEYECHSDQDGVELCNRWADVLRNIKNQFRSHVTHTGLRTLRPAMRDLRSRYILWTASRISFLLMSPFPSLSKRAKASCYP